MKRRIDIGFIIIACLVLWLCFKAVQIAYNMHMTWLDEKNTYTIMNAQGVVRSQFLESFMRGVSPDEIWYMNFIRAGGREPLYLGVITLTSNGIVQLKANTEDHGTGSFSDGSIKHIGGMQSERGRRLALRAASWWSLDERESYESRYLHWKGDHMAKFFIPRTGTVVYVEAVIH